MVVVAEEVGGRTERLVDWAGVYGGPPADGFTNRWLTSGQDQFDCSAASGTGGPSDRIDTEGRWDAHGVEGTPGVKILPIEDQLMRSRCHGQAVSPYDDRVPRKFTLDGGHPSGNKLGDDFSDV